MGGSLGAGRGGSIVLEFVLDASAEALGSLPPTGDVEYGPEVVTEAWEGFVPL